MLEAILEFFGELFLGSKKIKPWVKTIIVSVLVFALTGLFANGAYLTWREQGSIVGTVVMAVLGLAFFCGGVWLVWIGHKSRWDIH